MIATEIGPSRQTARKRWRAAGASMCAVLSVTSSAASGGDAPACLATNMPEQSLALTVKLQSQQQGGGGDYSHSGLVYWRRSPEALSQTLVCLTYPPHARGLAYLMHEGPSRLDTWAYLPEEGRVLRIHAKTAASRVRIARTAISYEDLRYLPLNLSGPASVSSSDSLLGERKVSEVQLSLPPGEKSQYARIVSLVDRESCVPLKTEFYAATGKLLKVLTADPDTISAAGKLRYARSLEIEDLEREVQTAVEVEKIEVDSDLEDHIFGPAYLQRGPCAK